jgi:hypothetical protein
MKKESIFDPERDAIVFGDLRSLAKLKNIQTPTQEDLRLHVAAVRRLLLEGELVKAASRRRMPVLFHPVDSNPLVRAVRNKRAIAFSLLGVNVFGVQFSGVFVNTGICSLNENFQPDKLTSLKLDSFLKQTVAMSPKIVQPSTLNPPKELIPSILIDRHDILLYVSNKIGGVHYDPTPNKQLSELKLKALGRMRRIFLIEARDGYPVVNFNLDCLEEENSSIFKYQPEKIDAIYLEFIAIVEVVLGSPEVSAVCHAIEKDLHQC